jgi:F-type H+-transporting ATPase subunit delta
MSESNTLARPYAVAAFRRAKETASADKWASQLEFLSAVMADDRIGRASNNPKVRREAFAQAFLGLCAGHLDRDGENFVRLLIQNQRLNLLGEIAELFNQFRADDEGYVDVDVASAFELTDDDRTKLSASLDAALGRRARLRTRVDGNLIGGVYIRAGDRVIDASIRGRIERLAKSLWN